MSSHQLVGFVFARRDLEGVDELGLVRLLTAGGVGSGDHVVQRPAQVRQLVGAARIQSTDLPARGDVGREGGVGAQPRHQVATSSNTTVSAASSEASVAMTSSCRVAT